MFHFKDFINPPCKNCQSIWNTINHSTKAAEKFLEITGRPPVVPYATHWNSPHDTVKTAVDIADAEKLSSACDQP